MTRPLGVNVVGGDVGGIGRDRPQASAVRHSATTALWLGRVR